MSVLNTPISKPFRILSIDGGGLRGLIALSILDWIEKEITHKKVYDCFDLFAGTSTGGLICCGLTLGDNNRLAPKYGVEDLMKMYNDNANKIFPANSGWRKKYRSCTNLFTAKHNKTGLTNILQDFFKDKRLSDCNKPIFIPTYDVDRLLPIYFTSRRINPSSNGYLSDPHANIKLLDLCRATSAAPTYLPSHRFIHIDDSNTQYQANCIDGGIFLNNPALAAYTEVLANATDPIYTNDPDEKHKIEEPEVVILSIGTGQTQKDIIPRKVNSWGKLKWVKPLIKIMMESNSASVDYQLRSIAKNRYLRININISDKYSEMDDSRETTLNYLKEEVKDQIVNNNSWTHQMNSFKNIANL